MLQSKFDYTFHSGLQAHAIHAEVFSNKHAVLHNLKTPLAYYWYCYHILVLYCISDYYR